MAPPKRKFCRESQNAIAFAELVLVLHSGEFDRIELCEQVGVSDSCLRGWMRYLRSRNLVVICEYRRTARTGAPKIIYTWNHNLEEKDVPKPKRKSVAEYSETYRQNKLLRKLHELGNTTY
jgi:transcription initiation factor IIE alpha subunit